MYCTKDELILRYGEKLLMQLTDHENAGIINDDLLTMTIADATNEIDSFFHMQYALPFSETPENVRRIACDLVLYRLYNNNVTELMQKRHEEDFKILSMYASGELKLFSAVESPTPNSVGNPVMTSSTPVFGRDNW